MADSGPVPGREEERPWLCPERRCTPLLNLRDGEYRDITVPEPGHSFSCWGVMEQPVTFVYDGVEHTNDCNACHYTPLKGLIRWQENPADWDVLSTYYAMARKRAEWCLSCAGTGHAHPSPPCLGPPYSPVLSCCHGCPKCEGSGRRA